MEIDARLDGCEMGVAELMFLVQEDLLVLLRDMEIEQVQTGVVSGV